MVFSNFEKNRSSFRNPIRVLGLLFTFHQLLLFTSCDKTPFETPEPPSFDWKASIYQNPVPTDQVQEADCDIMPPLNGPEPPFDGYAYYHTSPDPIVWKIKLNKSRRDMIAYISYVPDLEADQQEYAGYFTLHIKDLISGEVTLVDEMWQGYHLGFDFAGDYLIYEKNFEGYLYNWQNQEKQKLGNRMDFPSLSLNGLYMSYHDLDSEDKGEMVVKDVEGEDAVFELNDREAGMNLVWKDDNLAFTTIDVVNLLQLEIDNSAGFVEYLGPFRGGGLGFLVGFSQDQQYIYGNNRSLANLNTLEIDTVWYKSVLEDCGNRDLENFFVLPDNTFMMRKTYYISDHEKRTVYPEYHWHLFDADGSNERRVELQL